MRDLFYEASLWERTPGWVIFYRVYLSFYSVNNCTDAGFMSDLINGSYKVSQA